MDVSIPDPSKEEVNLRLEEWRRDENYQDEALALNNLFNKVYPLNNEVTQVLIKTASLDKIYSTSLYYPNDIARHIVELKIDDRLAISDLALVDDIARITIKGKSWRFYSFATKYCSYHRPNDYPIYDSYVEKVLKYFIKKDGFFEFKKPDLRDYSVFKDVLSAFTCKYKLEAFKPLEIDRYLWLLGKDKFRKRRD